VLAVLVLATLGVVGVRAYVGDAHSVETAAAQYLSKLQRGDTGTAYADWCSTARSAYPEALFRAQHADRAGHTTRVLGATVGLRGTTRAGSVDYRDLTEGQTKDLAMRKTDGRWEVCPSGSRLQEDINGCVCMTPTHHLEAHVARVLARPGSHYTLVEVRCPKIAALIDNKPVACTGFGSDGRVWSIVATESRHATYTSVSIRPGAGTPTASAPSAGTPS
jgi:hypothetical protein